MLDEDFPNIAIPDVILPIQFYDLFKAAKSPEEKLMLATLVTACNDFLGDKKLLQKSAKRWFEDTDSNQLFSFYSICLHLELEPTSFLAGINKSKIDKSVAPWEQIRLY